MKPEEKAEIILWDWLKTNRENSFIEEVYFNRKNQVNAPIFQTSGLNKKPDFLIKIDRGYGMEYIAVEIKDATKSQRVYDANKILRVYYLNYIKGKTNYFIDKEEIKINHFVIATQFSPLGHLFKKGKETRLINNLTETDDDKWRKVLAKYGQEPIFEWSATEQFQRNLFSQFKEFRKEYKLIDTPSIGTLYSQVLEKGITKKIPYIFIMNYNNYNPDFKVKWGCRYWRI